MKKIIRLTETDLQNLVKRVLKEQQDVSDNAWYNHPPVKEQMKKVKPDVGGKYCFSQKRLAEVADQPYFIVHKIKTGDTLEKLGNWGNGLDALKFDNNLCDLKKSLRAGDVILVSMAPSGRTP